MNNMSPLLISSLQEFSNHIKKAWFGEGFSFALLSRKIETIWNLNSWNESQLEVLGTHFICISSHCENVSEVLGHCLNRDPFSCSQSWCEPKARVTTLYTISIYKIVQLLLHLSILYTYYNHQNLKMYDTYFEQQWKMFYIIQSIRILPNLQEWIVSYVYNDCFVQFNFITPHVSIHSKLKIVITNSKNVGHRFYDLITIKHFLHNSFVENSIRFYQICKKEGIAHYDGNNLLCTI